MPVSDQFLTLGSIIIQNNVETYEDISNRYNAGWIKCREASMVNMIDTYFGDLK